MSMNAGYEVPAISSVCLETTKWSRRFTIWKFSCEFYLLHCYRNFILFSWSILCADPEGLVIWNETMDWRLKEINLIGDASMRARKTWKIKIKNNFKKWNWIQLNQETEMSEEIPQNVQPYLDREIKYISKSKWGRKSLRILALSKGEIMDLLLLRTPFVIHLKSRETNEQWQQQKPAKTMEMHEAWTDPFGEWMYECLSKSIKKTRA